MKKVYIFIFLQLLISPFIYSQTFSVSGNVKSSDDDVGLPGVSILIKGTTKGTTTDIDGNYQLNEVTSSDTLVYSYLGFISQEIKVGKQKFIMVSLQASAKEIEGVVVTALGIKREKREIGYTMESFSGEELQISNAPSVVDALSGRSAGVNVASANGVEGGTTRITIRGNNNIQDNNQPLIVVDGIPLENDPGLENIGRGVDWGSAINNINQSDIAETSILKGPTASALYGSRGANGVILITTKRGSKKKGIGVSYNYSYKLIHPYRYREVQNKYGAGGPISFTEPEYVLQDTLKGIYNYPSNIHADMEYNGLPTSTAELFGYYGSAVSWGPEMNGQLVNWWDGKVRRYTPQPDNLRTFYADGNTQNHNISFSGAGEMGSMRVSISRMDHTSIVPESKMDQTTINLGSNVKISSKVTADIVFSYINNNRLNSPVLGDSINSFSKGMVYSYPRSWKGIELADYANPDGSRKDWDFYPFQYVSEFIAWDLYNNRKTLSRDKLLGAFTLNFDITPWLYAHGRLGLDFTLNQFETRKNPTDVLGLVDGFYENELGRDIVHNNDFLITAHKENIGGTLINAKLSLGGAQYQRSLYGLKGKSGTWTNPWLFAMLNYSDANQITYPNREFRTEKDINSLYSFLNLSYSNYLFLEVTGRNDWSSTLPKDKNSYFYPSVSVSFIPTEVFTFFPTWFNFWKLRSAFAGTATDTNPYELDFVYTLGNFGGSQTASLPGIIPPIDLQPQFANSYEIGTNIGVFDNRIVADFTYYYIKSDNQIIESPIPASSGSSEYKIRINSGVMENKGWELVLHGVVLQNKNFIIETGLNFSRNRNYVVSLGSGAKSIELANIWDKNGPAIAVKEGEEYGTIIGFDYVYHENGQPILSDDGTTYKITENRVPIGNASPDFLGGWTTRISYKGFTLHTLIDTKWGGDIYCGSYVTGLQTGQSPETLLERDGGGLPYTDPEGNVRNVGVILDGVYEDGTPNDKVVHYYFKYMPNAGGWGHIISTPGIVENTWVKMREISLVYNFPQKLVDKTKVFQNLSLQIVGRDLFYIYTTLPDKINPEGLNGSGNAQGLEWASLPSQRSITFGINASF
ncbi:MAG: SusC/RagA family TonB-linked outer membrane protein [Bacteroidales bacterium]|nr:SusC/RagA family TonB-linked outer membrane protein [Bacteroidales bacterium]MCF8402807.1 SusC/RagA family TonB-linked outer membrane protein [Bacteroidales bacterium]